MCGQVYPLHNGHSAWVTDGSTNYSHDGINHSGQNPNKPWYCNRKDSLNWCIRGQDFATSTKFVTPVRDWHSRNNFLLHYVTLQIGKRHIRSKYALNNLTWLLIQSSDHHKFLALVAIVSRFSCTDLSIGVFPLVIPVQNLLQVIKAKQSDPASPSSRKARSILLHRWSSMMGNLIVIVPTWWRLVSWSLCYLIPRHEEP